MTGKKPYYITTPLYYVNDKPHIGHAYTNILCDTIARFRRFEGRKVFFLTGTDEHGEKVDKTARKEGAETKEFVDRIVPRFKELWQKLGISYDHFIRTTDPYHRESVYALISKLEKQGDIYKGKYSGWYCTPCESFWIDSQLMEGKCPDCRREVSGIQEENYFFKMSKHQSWLIRHIREHPGFIQPEERRKEVLGFLERGLEDLCITRPRSRLSWGIPFPNSAEYVIYVWFDALTNYISAVGYGKDEEKFSQYWPADVHMVGKDIIRHHAVYWTIMLHALGLPQPATIFGHGWWTISGSKVSKSRGNIVDPAEVAKNFGVDTLRYYFLHEVTLGADGAYSESLLVERYNKHLADELGNLLQRVISMLQQYTNGVLPSFDKAGGSTSSIETEAKGLGVRLTTLVNKFRLREAVETIWNLIRVSNRYVDDMKPWAMAKDKAKEKELHFCLMSLAEGLRTIGMALAPFLPETSRSILEHLNITAEPNIKDLDSWWALKPGASVQKPRVLFPKMEMEGQPYG
ncbi:MAG: methionine--tRNA ligase [Candidatus Omnitrophica bacterium]|nr:methionine--tRNA ligase [Candidatus Omnitrophota bacterium]